jgi:FkbM family methyltransferase
MTENPLKNSSGKVPLPSRPDLVIDVGMCDGTDTEYYLKKGFKVVAIEADPILCETAGKYFANEIRNGSLVILNVAIAENEGRIRFWRCLDKPSHSSAALNRLDDPSRFEEITVPAAGKLIRAVPLRFRPQIDWDSVSNPDQLRDTEKFGSGPFGEVTHGPWLTLDTASKRVAALQGYNANAWYDVHATRK